MGNSHDEEATASPLRMRNRSEDDSDSSTLSCATMDDRTRRKGEELVPPTRCHRWRRFLMSSAFSRASLVLCIIVVVAFLFGGADAVAECMCKYLSNLGKHHP